MPSNEQRALLRHMLATLAYRAAKVLRDAPPGFGEVNRFFDGLATLDGLLASDVPMGYSPHIIIQGPLADALTHVGQLALLRGVAGSPVRPESYARAEITAGRVGRDQAASKLEFDGDASGRPG